MFWSLMSHQREQHANEHWRKKECWHVEKINIINKYKPKQTILILADALVESCFAHMDVMLLRWYMENSCWFSWFDRDYLKSSLCWTCHSKWEGKDKRINGILHSIILVVQIADTTFKTQIKTPLTLKSTATLTTTIFSSSVLSMRWEITVSITKPDNDVDTT